MESQFWGVVLQPEKIYEQTVESSFHVSMAAIEASSMGSKATSVFVEAGGDEYLICNLNSSSLNVHLDLNFIEGEKIGFRSIGSGTIHLTGYLLSDSGNPFGDEFDDSDEESEEEEVPILVNGKGKRKSEDSSSNSPGVPSKKSKKELALARANKVLEEYAAKKKLQEVNGDEDDDTSDDGILDFTENYAEEEDSEDSDEDKEEDSDDEDDEMEVSPPPKKTPEKESTKKQKPQTPKSEKVKEPVTPKSGKLKEPVTPNSSAKKDAKKSPKPYFKNGIQCEELRMGSGPDVKKGKVIGMYYDGRLKSNNKRFDATLTGKPFKFRLGVGEVIKGWDLGLEGMKVGGKRRITVPPKMAYGARGAPPDIPANAALVFEVECKFVN
uniref:FK506-binding protein n=2 Tax=Caligus rogercresseyi TaxID=217165 RepID=C1BPM1_CALRO|nr:46 kDa FK506-binding nuclear protein [Caligus rogercresseyi]